MSERKYPSDLSEREWQILAPLIPPAKTGGYPKTTSMRRVRDAIYYQLKTGYPWEWDDVGQYSLGITPNAFQIRLKDIEKGNFTIEFRYEIIQWYGGNAAASYSAANGTYFWKLPQSGTSFMLALETAGNTSEPGIFFFSIVNGIPNQPPSDITLSQSSVDENSSDGTAIGTFSTINPDARDLHFYTLLDDAGGRFAINGNILVVANGGLLDYETNPSYNIIVRTTDTGNLFYDQSFIINLNNLPEPDLRISAFTAPLQVNLGETSEVSWTVTNEGDGDGSIPFVQ